MASKRKHKSKFHTANKVSIGDTIVLSNGVLAKVTSKVPYQQEVKQVLNCEVMTFQVAEGEMEGAFLNGVFLASDKMAVSDKIEEPGAIKRFFSRIKNKVSKAVTNKPEVRMLPPQLPVWDADKKEWIKR